MALRVRPETPLLTPAPPHALTPLPPPCARSVGYDPRYGARPLKRAIQAHLLNPLARSVLGGEVRDEQAVTVDVSEDGHGLAISSRDAEPAELEQEEGGEAGGASQE